MPTEPAPLIEDSREIRREVITTCLQVAARGYFLGTWGNVSVRLADGLLVTPSRMDYALIQPEDLVVVSWQGTKLRGNRVATSEAELHRLLLQRRPDLGAIIHAHSPYASVFAVAQQPLPVCVEDLAQIIGGEVRCTPFVPGGNHRGLAEAAADAMGGTTCAALLGNHGVVVGGRTLAEASVALQVLEKAAQLNLLARLVGGAQTIPPELVTEARHDYLYKYGKQDVPAANR